jgi:hypothetical protein
MLPGLLQVVASACCRLLSIRAARGVGGLGTAVRIGPTMRFIPQLALEICDGNHPTAEKLGALYIEQSGFAAGWPLLQHPRSLPNCQPDAGAVGHSLGEDFLCSPKVVAGIEQAINL